MVDDANQRHEYALERSQREYERLALQGEILKPMTRRLFSEAGIEPGMRIVDLGSGAGDVCLLLAEMVGPHGSVIGLELDEAANRFAAERARRAGFGNIEFVHANLSQFVPNFPIDAVVGRMVLAYQTDPAAVLRRFVKHLKIGGPVVFLEPWFMPPAGPDSMLKRVGTINAETLRRSGAHTDLGLRLHTVFLNAGLPLPKMRFEVALDPRPDSPLPDYAARTVAHLLPKAIEYGVVQPGEFDSSIVAQCLVAEMNATGYPNFGPPLILAWSTKQ